MFTTALGGYPAARRSATDASPSRFESFPSLPRTMAWWMKTGGSAPSARNAPTCRSSLARWSPPRMMWVIPKSRSSTTLAQWYVGRPSPRTITNGRTPGGAR